MRGHRVVRVVARTGAHITGLLIGAISVSASAPSFNSDIAGAPRMKVSTDTASLSITVRTCPAGYDPAKVGADYRRDCREPAGDTLFHLDQMNMNGPSASTGTSGDAPQESTVQFSGVSAGRYHIRAEAPAGIASAFIGACDSNARSFDSYPVVPFARVVESVVTLDLLPGETLTCDWYQVNAPAAN